MACLLGGLPRQKPHLAPARPCVPAAACRLPPGPAAQVYWHVACGPGPRLLQPLLILMQDLARCRPSRPWLLLWISQRQRQARQRTPAEKDGPGSCGAPGRLPHQPSGPFALAIKSLRLLSRPEDKPCTAPLLMGLTPPQFVVLLWLLVCLRGQRTLGAPSELCPRHQHPN